MTSEPLRPELPRPLRPSADAVRRRLGRAAGIGIAGGWALTLLAALGAGAHLEPHVLVLALVGSACGLALANRAWERLPERSLRLAVATVALHAVAALLAVAAEPALAAPFLAFAAALAAQALGGRLAVLATALGLTVATLVVGAVGPAADAGTLREAAVLAPALMLVASASAFVRAARAAAWRRALGDARRAHAPLARRAATDPDRLAKLTMDLDLQAGAGTRSAEGNRLLHDVAAALVEGAAVERAHADRSAAAALLAERIDRVLSGLALEEVSALNAAVGFGGLSAGEEPGLPADLVHRADEALREARARRGVRPSLPAERAPDRVH